MVSQSAWIGITIGVFFVGLLIGIGSFSGSMNMWNMPMQNQQTMGDNDQLMHEMMQDYDNREHMMGHLVEDNDLLEDMGLEFMIQSGMDGNMGQNMMGMMNSEMMNQIMTDPQKREMMMSMMKEHVFDMDKLLSSNLSDQEFSEKMSQLMYEHMFGMQELMQVP